MKYLKFGRTGLDVSRLCLGCMSYGVPERGAHPWTLGEAQSRPFIRRALDLGINFFDTANVYSDGTQRGDRRPRAGRTSRRRDEVVIATKVNGRMRKGPNGAGLSRKAIMTEIDASLRRLGTDYVDLYQIHRWDYGTPIEETLEALHDVVKAGKARYIGASSMYAWQFAKALHVSRAQRLDALRQHAEPPQPALPRGGARDAAAVPRPGHRRDPVEPDGARPADPRLGRDERAHRDRRLRRARCTSPAPPRRIAAWSRRSPRWPRRAACRARRSRWRGCCTSAGSPRRSSARRSSNSSTTRSRRCRSRCPPRRSRRWSARTSRTRWSGTPERSRAPLRRPGRAPHRPAAPRTSLRGAAPEGSCRRALVAGPQAAGVTTRQWLPIDCFSFSSIFVRLNEPGDWLGG